MAEYKIITNLESKDIYVFPAGLRGSTYNKSKFTTEDNLILFNKISANDKNLNRVYDNPFGDGLIIKIAGYCFTFMPELLVDQFDIQEFEDSTIYALITLVDKGDGIGKVLANVNPSVAAGVAPEMAGDYIYTLDSQEGNFYKFLGLAFVDGAGLSDILNNSYYKNNFSNDEYQVEYLKIKESGSLSFLTQKLALDASEIRNTENSDESLSEALNTDTLRVETITGKTGNPIKFDAQNKFGKTLVNFSSTNDINIVISKAMQIYSALTIGDASTNTGMVTIKSAGTGNTTVIGPSSGTINLPANYTGSFTAVLAQKASDPNKSTWLRYDAANTANTLVLRDSNNINATTFNNVYVTKNTDSFNSFNIWTGASSIGSTSTKAYIKMSGKFTVAGNVVASLNSSLDIAANSEVDIDVPFNVGADGKTGGVNISSSGNKATTVIGPSDGTTILPDSKVVPQTAATGYKYIWAQHHSTSGIHTNSWIPVSALADQPNAIVMTDAQGKVHATIEGLIDKATTVKQIGTNAAADYPMLFTTNSTNGNHVSIYYSTGVGIKVNPSTSTITATNFAGRASESTKVKVAQDTTNANYRILFSPTTTTGSYVEIKYTNDSLYVNPNTGVLGATELKSTTITNTGAISSNTISATTSMTAPIFIGDLQGNADTATKFQTNATVQLTGDVTGSASSQHGWTVATTLANSGVTAGSYGLSANATPGFGVKFNVPYFTVNAKGLITAASTKTVQIPATIAKYDTLGLVKPAYTSTGEASFTTTAATNTSTPTISEKTTTAGRYYGIEADKNGRLFVNVPWVNTTYDASDGIKLDGTTFKHSYTLTAKSAANNAATTTPGFGGTITTYETLYNTYGHVTGTSSSTVTIPATIAKYNTLGLVKPAYTSSNAATLTTAAATNTTTPTIQTKSTTSNRYYGVEADKDGVLFVNVPWTNTTYSFTDNNPTLAWSTKSKVATVGGVDIHVTMPANPNTDTKVTAVGNHYTPSADTNAELTASISGTAAAYAKNTEYTVLTGVKAQRDAKGHITGLTYTAQKIKDTNTTYSFSNKAATLAWGTTSTIATVGGTDITVTMPANPNTNTAHAHSAGDGISLSGSGGTSGTTTISLAASGVSAGSYGNSSNQTPGYGSTFNVPYITVDTYGRITAISNKTVKIPASDNTNTSHSHSAGVGLTGSGSAGTGSGTYTYKVNLVNETVASNAASYTAGGTSKFYAVQLDKNSKLGVYVPWSNTTYSFTDNNPTLAWSTKSKVATVGGVDIHVTMPANPNTDAKVTQNLKSDSKEYSILLKNNDTKSGTPTDGVNYSALVYVNAQSGLLTAKSFNASSDARLKENFQPLKLSGKSILDLPVYRFDFKDGSLKNQIGCKAQDLQEICPEIVNENNEGFLSIQESKIVYLLLEEVKQLKAEIEALKNK